jgi:hypothetical protein
MLKFEIDITKGAQKSLASTPKFSELNLILLFEFRPPSATSLLPLQGAGESNFQV